MNTKEMYNEMKTIPFEPQGKLPENLEYLHCSNVIVVITEEQQKKMNGEVFKNIIIYGKQKNVHNELCLIIH